MKKNVFLILCLEAAILSFNVAASAALVPSIAKDFLVSQFFAGRIIWLYMIPYGLAALIYGPLVRLFDAKKIEMTCLGLFSLANLLAGLSANIYQLFWARFLTGIFGASVIPVGIILIGQQIEADKRGKHIGLFFGATFIASLCGLFLSGVLPWRVIFIIPAVAGICLCLAMYFYLPCLTSEEGIFRTNYLNAFQDRRFLSVFTYIFFISLIYHGLQQWLAVYFSFQLGLGQFLISMLITLTSVSGIFGEVLGGRLADSLGRLKTIKLGIILMILSAFSLVIKMPIFLLALLMIIWGWGWTMNHVGLSTILTDLPKNFLYEAASLNSSIRFISGGIGAGLGGMLLQKSPVSNFVFCGGCLTILLLLEKRLLLVNRT
ncbi:MAG: MFS transporter [Candidatus Omnitrophica bacterium]|nr:MFS transporter [Candidatus Omnitrophota bacterium]